MSLLLILLSLYFGAVVLWAGSRLYRLMCVQMRDCR